MERAGGQCEWPNCGTAYDLQLAHISPRGMGGTKYGNVLANVCMLCVYHHDILDGRTVRGRAKAVQDLLLQHLTTKWRKDEKQPEG
jgi:hypothetical protein